MTAGTAPDWRTLNTPEAEAEFADAQARLDNLDHGDDGYTPEQVAADEKVADQYDRIVLQPAYDEWRDQREREEFDQLFPEPPDGTRIEFERDDVVYGAYRQDCTDTGGDWWMYGSGVEVWSWRRLVTEYEIDMDELVLLMPVAETTEVVR